MRNQSFRFSTRLVESAANLEFEDWDLAFFLIVKVL